MPLFDYKCPACQTTEERLVKSSDTSQFCSKCTSPMQKLLAAPTFVLKGAGFTNGGTYANTKDGPKLDKDFLRLSNKEMNRELNIPENCDEY